MVLGFCFSLVVPVAAGMLTGRHVLIEFACDDSSEVGRVGAELGTRVLRFTKAGPDLSSKEGLRAVLKAVADNPGADILGSLPCTTVSALQNANLKAAPSMQGPSWRGASTC